MNVFGAIFVGLMLVSVFCEFRNMKAYLEAERDFARPPDTRPTGGRPDMARKSRQIHTRHPKVLGIRSNLIGSRIRYFSNGQLIATFDGGPCNIYFAGGKDYGFFDGPDTKIQTRVYRKNLCKINAIYDFNEKEVPAGTQADRIIYGFDGTTKYYKSMGVTIPAHSETPQDGANDWVIVCGDNVYRAHSDNGLFSGETKLFKGDTYVGCLINSFFPGFSRMEFEVDFSLTEQVFLTHLAHRWH